ncbi:MAG: hypothetical protein V7700_16450 [Halioglobus sp.]
MTRHWSEDAKVYTSEPGRRRRKRPNAKPFAPTAQANILRRLPDQHELVLEAAKKIMQTPEFALRGFGYGTMFGCSIIVTQPAGGATVQVSFVQQSTPLLTIVWVDGAQGSPPGVLDGDLSALQI